MVQRKNGRPFAAGMVGGCVLWALAGCSGNSGSGSSSPSPDFSGASSATGAEVSASVGSMTMQSSASTGGALANFQRIANSHPDNLRNGCGTVVVNSANAQGQVTSETITYSLPACEFTGVLGNESLAITGVLGLTIPDPTQFSFSTNATNLEYAFTSADVTSSETRNGTRQLTATANLLNEANNITTQFQKAGANAGTAVNSLAFSFTPVSGSNLAVGQPLPDGTLSVSGGLTWTAAASGSTADNFTVTTVTPLVYDSSCPSTSASVFDSGQLKVAIADGSVPTYARITWSNCGSPSVVVY